MAKVIEIVKQDGSVDVYKSGWFRGYHLKEAGDGYCVTEKRFFRPERTVQCYLNYQVSSTSAVRCGFCEWVNSTQRTRG